MRRTLFMGLCLIAMVFQSPEPAKAQSLLQLQPSPPAVEKSTSQAELELIKEHYKNLKEQNEKLQMAIQNERDLHYKFVEKTYTETKNFIYVFIGLATAFIGFLNWKTKDDLKKSLDNFEKQAEQSAKTKFDEVIMREAVSIKLRVDTLNEIINRETSYKKKRIGIIGNPDQLKEIGDVLDFLKRKNFENQPNQIDESDLDVNQLPLTDIDILIYLFKDPHDKLGLILDRLKDLKDKKIPIVIFANEGLRIPNDMMAKYDRILPANGKITLINSIFTVSNVLSE